ncbi:MAG: ACT domain-containing protein [Candidatus Marinimicrobia bacterium]|nr:ACT domain-containing protein [Candidatus Neomarinimicrobiota bacterium]MDD5230892.1 ACT domain-containing protein [Candidatus Neomarinimicrobiota bacterium]
MKDQEKIIIGGMIELRDLMMFSVLALPDQPGSAGRVLTYFGQNGISVDFITESSNLEGTADLTFCIGRQNKSIITQTLQDLKTIIQAKDYRVTEPVAIVSFYGPHFREKPAIAGKICQTLGAAGINILGISTSISSISCVVYDNQVNTVHQAIAASFKFAE